MSRRRDHMHVPIAVILAGLLILAAGGTASGFEVTVLVVPSYQIVEEAHDLHVTYAEATRVYTLRYAAHNVVRIWAAGSGRSDEIERTIAARTEQFIDLSPFGIGVHRITSSLLESHPSQSETIVVGDDQTVPADNLSPVDPTGPGLTEADIQDDRVADAPAVLVSHEYLVLRDAEDDAATEVRVAAVAVDESTNVANEERSGDPVLVASGMFTTSETDLMLSAGAVAIAATRVHRTDLGLAGSLGSAWWLSFDTRIVLGESRRAADVEAVASANAGSILTADVASLAQTYAAARAVITAPMVAAEARLEEARQTYAALAHAKLTYHGDYRTAVIAEINRQLLIAGRLVAEGETLLSQFHTHLSNLDVAYGTVATGALGLLYSAAAEHRAVAEAYGLHAVRANSHATRNNRFIPGSPAAAGPPADEGSVVEDARAAGNNSVTVVDSEGVPRRFSYVNSADMASERTYSDGSPNYFPSGADLRPEKPTEDTLRLTPEGQFVLTRKDGSRRIFGVHGQLLRSEDRNGNRVVFHYNTEEQLSLITDSRGREVILSRSPAGLLTDLSAPESTRIHYDFDAAGELASVTDPAGDTVRYQYEQARITRITKPDESFREYRYEYIRGALRATRTTDEEGKAETFDFTLPDRTVYTNPSGVQTVYHFNLDRRVTRIDHEGGWEYPAGLSEQFAYNSAGDRTYHRATDGSVYRYAFDERHNLLRADYPDGTADAWTYTALGLPHTSLNRRNQLTSYRYDGLGNLTRVEYPDGTADLFTYELPGAAGGEIATYTDRRGNLHSFAYDSLGFLKSISDMIGSVARYEHDALGRETAREDGLGYRTEFTYTPDGRLDSVTGPEGLFVRYEYDERKDLVWLVNSGRATTFTYDDRHLPATVTNALGETRSYVYQDDGKLYRRSVRSADGARESITEFEYNARGLLHREVQTDIGAVIEYEYDAAGRVAAVTDATGSRTEYRYSYDGRLIGRTRFNDGRPIIEAVDYYPGGPMQQALDPLGRTTRWEHDPASRTLMRVDPLWSRSQATFDPYDLVLSETDPTGRSRFYDYDERGRLVAVRNNLNVVARYAYDLADNLISFTDGEHNIWQYEYDGRGRLLTTTHPDGAIRTIRYNNDNTIASETDETGLTTTYEYDLLGWMIARTDPGRASNADPAFAPGPTPGRRTEYAWNYLGTIESVTDPTGRETTYFVDPAGRITGSADNTGAVTAYERNPAGTVTAVTDPTGRRTDYVYDDLHRLTATLRAGEQTARYEYDDAGNIRFEYDGADEPHEYLYDDLNRLKTEINRLGDRRHYAYDDAGRPMVITDYGGGTAELTYDDAGLLSEVAHSDGAFQSFQYDRAGRMISALNQHERLGFSYTASGFLGSVSGGGTTLLYDYDPAGRRTALTNLITGRRTDYLYDDRGFLTGLDDSVAGFTSFEYDAAGRRTQIAAPNGVVTSTTHDAAGRVAATVVTNRSLANPVIYGLAHVYDEAGRRIYDVDHRGAITGYGYDDQGRLSRVQYPFSSPKRLADYDMFAEAGLVPPVPIGQTLGEEFAPGPANAAAGGTPYQSYLFLLFGTPDLIEEAYRLIHPLKKGGVSINQQVWTETFDYDAAGNRATWRTGWGRIGYTYDAAGRLERAAGAVYDHDVAGNLTSVTTSSGATRHSYTAGNRLAGAVTPGETIVYTYDPLGRRSSRTASAAGDPERGTGGTAALTKAPAAGIHRTVYRYDGHSFTVISREEAEYSAAGDLSSLVKDPSADVGRYRPAPGQTLPPGAAILSRAVYQEASLPSAQTLSISGPSGTTYLSHDVLGSVRVSTGALGAPEATYQYDAFGTTLAGHLDPGQPYGHNGKPQDPATGLANYGFRDYSPAIARFTTPDPIRDGSNWYRYANNDPLNQLDPWGLAPRNLTDAQRVAYKDHVAEFAVADALLPTYDSGPREGQEWDCADLATYIASGAMDSATDESDFYRNLTGNGSALASIPAIHSSDFAEDGNVTFYRNTDDSIDNAFSSPNVEAGTIGVFSNHVITVTADRAGTSDAIQTIQGHLRRDATWPDIVSQTTLDEYLGTFIGWSEIRSGNTRSVMNSSLDDDSGIKNR